MKKILLFLLAAVMVFSLAACGENNSTPSGGTGNTSGKEPSAPADGWAAEYTILIGGSDEWTPFAGKSDVTFANSDDKAIDVSDNGTTVEFTGKKVGESVITATLDGTESKAIVRVRAAETGVEDLLKWRLPVSLYLKAQSNDSYCGKPREFYWTGAEYEYIAWEESGDGSIRTIIQYSSGVLGNYYYWDGEEDEYRWSVPGDGWGDDILGGSYLFGYGKTIPTLIGDMEKNHGGNPFRPLNDFAFAVQARHNFIVESPDISEFRTGRHETVLGVNCDVFEVPEDIVLGGVVLVSKGTIYYVDPTTHYTLKTVRTDGTVDEVLEYDADYSGGVPYAPGEPVSIE